MKVGADKENEPKGRTKSTCVSSGKNVMSNLPKENGSSV